MKYLAVSELSKAVGQQVVLKGWAANVRSSGKIHFIELRDGSGFVQVVVNQGACPRTRGKHRKP